MLRKFFRVVFLCSSLICAFDAIFADLAAAQDSVQSQIQSMLNQSKLPLRLSNSSRYQKKKSWKWKKPQAAENAAPATTEQSPQESFESSTSSSTGSSLNMNSVIMPKKTQEAQPAENENAGEGLSMEERIERKGQELQERYKTLDADLEKAAPPAAYIDKVIKNVETQTDPSKSSSESKEDYRF